MQSDTKPEISKQFYQTRWFKVLAGLVIFYLAFLLFVWAGLPPLIKWQAEKQVLAKSGHHLTMDKPKINPLSWNIELDNVALKTPENQVLTRFRQFAVDLDWVKLFKGQIAFKRIYLDGFTGRLALLPEGKLNWTPLIEAFSGPPKQEPEPQKSEGPPPNVFVSDLEVKDSSFWLADYRKPKGFETELKPINFELKNLSTRSSKDGAFELLANTSLGASVKVHGSVNLKEFSVDGDVALNNLNFRKLQPVMAAFTKIPAPEGSLNATAKFDVTLPEGKLQAKITNGEVNIDGLQYQAKAGSTFARAGLKRLQLKGIEYDLQQGVVKTAGLNIQDLSLKRNAQSKDKALLVEQLAVGPTEVSLNQQNASVGAVSLTGGHVLVDRDRKGNLNLLDLINGLTPPADAFNVARESKPIESKQEQPVSVQKVALKTMPQESGGEPVKQKAEKPQPWRYSVPSVSLSGIGVDYQDASLGKGGLAVGLRNVALSTQNVTQNLNKALPLKFSATSAAGGSLAASGQIVPSTAAVNLKLNVRDLSIKPAQPMVSEFVRLSIMDGKVSTKGTFNLKKADFSYKGNLSVNRLKLNETGTRNSILRFSSLSTPAFSVNAKRLDMRRLTLSGLDTAILIAKDKSTNIGDLMVKSNDKAASSAPAASKSSTSKAPPFLVNIGQFRVRSSKLKYEDLSLVLPFGAQVENLQGSMVDLSTKPNTKGRVDLKGQVNQYGEFLAKGALNLSNPTQFLDVAVNFKNIEMVDLTPYSATFANRKIKSGKLALNLKYDIKDNQLNSTNQVLIDNLVLGDKVDSPQGTNLPLDLAIALLEDSNGRIDLGVPVYGNLNDPQFSVGQVVWKAFTNILTKLVTSPFRALASLLGSGDQLQTVAFQPGMSTLSPSQQENLANLAKALQKRPNLNLTLAGTYSDADKQTLATWTMRKAVLTKAYKKAPAAEEVQTDLSFDQPEIQKALVSVFEAKLGKSEYLGFKNAYEKANPGELKQGLGGKLLGSLSGLLDKPRQFSAQEVAALKDKDFYPELADRISAAEKVTQAQLDGLADSRLQYIDAELLAKGIAKARMVPAKPEQVDFKDGEGVPLKLSVKPGKAVTTEGTGAADQGNTPQPQAN